MIGLAFTQTARIACASARTSARVRSVRLVPFMPRGVPRQGAAAVPELPASHPVAPCWDHRTAHYRDLHGFP